MGTRMSPFGENRNHVSWLQYKVLGSVVLQNEFAQIEWDQNSLERVLVESFDDSIIPVNFGSKKPNLSALCRAGSSC